MKKFWKYSSLFFALYNFFLVIVAIFDLFHFPNGALRMLLALEAFHVTIYKLFEYLDDKRPNTPDPALNKTVSIKATPAPIIHLKEASIEHKEVYYEFSETIKKNLARNLGEKMFNDNLITFTVQEEIPDRLTTIAEVKIVADCGGT